MAKRSSNKNEERSDFVYKVKKVTEFLRDEGVKGKITLDVSTVPTSRKVTKSVKRFLKKRKVTIGITYLIDEWIS